MKILRAACLGLLLLSPVTAHATADDLRSLAGMQSHNPALLVFAPSLADARMTRQHAIMARLAIQAASRDLLFVQVDTTRVVGSHDTPEALRRRFRVPLGAFRALVIDKSGKVVLTSPAPIPSGTILRAVDMRR